MIMSLFKIEKRSIFWTKMHLIPSFGPVSKGLVPVFDHFEIIIFRNKFRSSFLLFGQKFPKNY